MDTFWHSLRIGCIGLFALVVLGIGSCTFLMWREELPRSRLRDALWNRSLDILKEKKQSSVAVSLKELFGNELDGACVVFNGRFHEDQMLAASPAKFAPAISAIAQVYATPPSDSDTLYWQVYTVKDGSVIREYDLVFRSTFDMDAPAPRCYEPETPLQIEKFRRAEDGKDSIYITILGGEAKDVQQP